MWWMRRLWNNKGGVIGGVCGVGETGEGLDTGVRDEVAMSTKVRR